MENDISVDVPSPAVMWEEDFKVLCEESRNDKNIVEVASWLPWCLGYYSALRTIDGILDQSRPHTKSIPIETLDDLVQTLTQLLGEEDE